ncbi:MAG: ABC transporter ATP-binding protein [Paludibacter sp.]
MALLEVNNVSKSFRTNHVLNQITFAQEAGTVVAITGENGTGKTTLLNIITGWLKPDSGTIGITRNFGFCPQEPLVFPALTVQENLSLFETAYSAQFQDYFDKTTTAALLEEFRLTESLNKRAGILSGGTRQKLNFVLALLHNPDLMILDEPYASLDRDTYQRFWSYAERKKETGKSILIVSHFVYDQTLIDKLYSIKNGCLICE